MVKALDDLATVELCPRCATRDQGEAGFCDPCLASRVAEDFTTRDAIAIDARREAWRARSHRIGGKDAPAADTPERLRERQRRHRLLEQVRPREPAHSGADPYQLAKEALSHLARLRMVVRRHHLLAPDLEAAEELVRQLAWGPGPTRP